MVKDGYTILTDEKKSEFQKKIELYKKLKTEQKRRRKNNSLKYLFIILASAILIAVAFKFSA